MVAEREKLREISPEPAVPRRVSARDAPPPLEDEHFALLPPPARLHVGAILESSPRSMALSFCFTRREKCKRNELIKWRARPSSSSCTSAGQHIFACSPSLSLLSSGRATTNCSASLLRLFLVAPAFEQPSQDARDQRTKQVAPRRARATGKRGGRHLNVCLLVANIKTLKR